MGKTFNIFAREQSEERLNDNRPVALGALTHEEFDAEIEEGMADIECGRVWSAKEVEIELKSDLRIGLKRPE